MSSFHHIGGQFRNEDIPVQYIDPRLLEKSTTETAPHHDVPHPDHCIDPALRGGRDQRSPSHGTPTPGVSRSSSLRPEAAEFIPSGVARPHLTLRTGPQGLAATHSTEAVSPTPEIRVLAAPIDFDSIPTAQPRRVNQSRGRGRRRSSPARRITQSLASRSALTRFVSEGDNCDHRLLSPVRAWIRDQYNAGDRMSFRSDTNRPPPLPDQASLPPSTPSPSVTRTRPRGVFFCNQEGCKRSNKPFNTEAELRKHQRSHLPKELRPHACTECPQRFNDQKDLNRHIRSKHQGGMALTCPSCGQTLSRGDNLQRHMLRQHSIVMTPSTMESAAASPASTTASISNLSESMYSATSPSTAENPAWSPAQNMPRVFQQGMLLAASYFPPIAPMRRAPPPTSVPMTKSYSNEF